MVESDFRKATVTDGALNVDDLLKQVLAEFPKHAVPKADFNVKVQELSTANKTIADLKKENSDNQELQEKITGYETEIAKLKKSVADTEKTYTLKEQLSKQGVLEKFNFDKEGKPIGIEETLKPYKEDKTMAHLFK